MLITSEYFLQFHLIFLVGFTLVAFAVRPAPGHPAHPLAPSVHQPCTRTSSVRRTSSLPSSPRITNNRVLIRTFSMANPSRTPKPSRSRCRLLTNTKTSLYKTTATPTSYGSSNSKSSSFSSYTSYNNRYSNSRSVVAAFPNLVLTHDYSVDGNTEWNPTSRTVRPDVQSQSD